MKRFDVNVFDTVVGTGNVQLGVILADSGRGSSLLMPVEALTDLRRVVR